MAAPRTRPVIIRRLVIEALDGNDLAATLEWIETTLSPDFFVTLFPCGARNQSGVGALVKFSSPRGISTDLFGTGEEERRVTVCRSTVWRTRAVLTNAPGDGRAQARRAGPFAGEA